MDGERAAKGQATPKVDRLSLARRYAGVRAQTEALTASLTPEDAQIQSMPDASPAKWHLAHTAWFFETFLLAPNVGYQPFDPDFSYLFNSYYEALGPRYARPQRGLITRPGLDRIKAYRAHVDAQMARLIESLEEEALAAVEPAITLGLNHEQQHQELILMDIKHAFSSNPLEPAYGSAANSEHHTERPLSWIAFDGGLRRIGHEGDAFGFDNEAPRHKVWLERFDLADL